MGRLRMNSWERGCRCEVVELWYEYEAQTQVLKDFVGIS